MIVVTNEYDPGPGEWLEARLQESTTFDVTAVDGRLANDFWVCGVATNGDDVIEHWTLEVPVGGWIAKRPVSTIPLGTPAATPETAIVLRGSDFLPFAQRPQAPHIARRELYRGDLLGGVLSVEADPDGRYLMLLTEAKEVYQLPIHVGASPLLLYDTSDTSTLANAHHIDARDHASLGRVYSIVPLAFKPSSLRILLIDDENDGVIDSLLELPGDQVDALPDEWTDFVFF